MLIVLQIFIPEKKLSWFHLGWSGWFNLKVEKFRASKLCFLRLKLTIFPSLCSLHFATLNVTPDETGPGHNLGNYNVEKNWVSLLTRSFSGNKCFSWVLSSSGFACVSLFDRSKLTLTMSLPSPFIFPLNFLALGFVHFFPFTFSALVQFWPFQKCK